MADLDPVPTLMSANFCGEMVRSPVQLFKDWLSGCGAVTFPQGLGKSIAFTQSGRAAILLATRAWGITENDEILVPSYHCGSEISPLVATGAQVSMYRVDANARIDVADIVRRITPRTKLIHIIHYFGQPAQLENLPTMCRAQNIKLLEDCALSLFSASTGHLGDAAIFSFRKSLPACGGGALVFNSEEIPKFNLRKPDVIETARDASSLLRKWGQSILASGQAFPPEICISYPIEQGVLALPDLPASYYCGSNATICHAPRIALGALKRSDVHDTVLRRRENYARLRQSLADIEPLTFLWKDEMLPEGMCPLGLPLLVENKMQWCAGLKAAGVAVTPWWLGCHRGLDWTEFPEAIALKSRLILLPVHQDLSPHRMEYTASVIRALVHSGINKQ